MSYFSHGFKKVFVGTKATQAGSGTAKAVNNGMLIAAGVPTSALGTSTAPYSLGVGTYGFFSNKTYLSVTAASAEVTQGQALILAGASNLPNDKIGPFHGGYAESNKSKYINPKMVTNFYKMESAQPQQAIYHIGVTNFQVGTSLSIAVAGVGLTPGSYTNIPVTGGSGTGMTVDVVVDATGEVISVVENNIGSGYIAGETVTLDATLIGGADTDAEFDIDTYGNANCEFEFLCGETYNLFINLWGSPILRYLNHDSYRNLSAYTGCCPADSIAPVAVDSTLVMIDWAKQIITSPWLKDFVRPIVFDESGNPWFATAAEAVAEGWPTTQIWDNYVSTGHIPGAVGGIRLIGAYVDRKFGTCTFQTSDFYEKEIVKMQVQMVDANGDPCAFSGLCVTQECCGFGGQGFGETYLRELILAESYLQNKFSTDPRIREITQGTSMLTALPPNLFYNKYVIQHIVPRYNNPSSVHDDDQYNLVIYVPEGVTATALETFMATWLTAAGNPLGADITANGVTNYTHVECEVTALPVFPA